MSPKRICQLSICFKVVESGIHCPCSLIKIFSRIGKVTRLVIGENGVLDSQTTGVGLSNRQGVIDIKSSFVLKAVYNDVDTSAAPSRINIPVSLVGPLGAPTSLTL